MAEIKHLVIDVGGTKIKSGIITIHTGVLSNVLEFKTPEYGVDNFLNTLDKIIIKYLDKDIHNVSISMNGQIQGKTIVFSRILGGKVDLDISKYLFNKFKLNVKIDNDVNCMALGFYKCSSEKYQHMLLLNLGTGIRFGYVYEERLLKGRDGYFGEIRDEIYIKELQEQININDLVCGRGISNIFYKLFHDKISAKEIYSQVLLGDEKCKIVLNIFVKYLVQVLIRVSYHYNPEVIVIDGSLKVIIADYLNDVLEEYNQHCERHFVSQIIIGEIENSNLFGAYYL